MKRLFLADLKGMTEVGIKKHISEEYAPEYDKKASSQLLADLDAYDVLIAYESVGDYGCDSSSWFLLRRKSDKGLFEVHGSHCSCYGFEGQWDGMESTTLEYLKSDHFTYCSGGYEYDPEASQTAVKAFIRELTAEVTNNV